MFAAVALPAPFTVAVVANAPVNVAASSIPGCVGKAVFNKVGYFVAVVGKLTVNAVLLNK